jgi:hypothetical protein
MALATTCCGGAFHLAQALKGPKEAANDAVFDRRKAKRLFLFFPIEISGVDQDGRAFQEHTKTDDISDTGCRLVTSVRLNCGDRINIRLTPPPGTRFPEESPVQFEVMWIHPINSGWSIGVRNIHGGKIWKVSFPPSKSST